MKRVSRSKLISIINNLQPHAKTVCDRIYEKTAEAIGGNERFKELIDGLFTKISESQIKIMVTEIENLYEVLQDDEGYTLKAIEEYTELCRYTQNQELARGAQEQGSRRNGKTLNAAANLIINAHRVAFVEMLATDLGVDLSENTN